MSRGLGDVYKRQAYNGDTLSPKDVQSIQELFTSDEVANNELIFYPEGGMGLLEKEAAIMDPLVHDDFLKVKEVLDTKSFAEVLRPRINQRFDEIWEKLRTSSDIAAIKNIKLESDTLKIKCLDEIDEYERAHQPAPEPPVAPVVPGKESIDPTPVPTKVKTKRRKNVSISNVAGARTYSIETEQDIDKFLAEMKQKLMNELEEDTIITLS